MYLMYVDESGDSGPIPPHGKSQTRFFCITGLVVHELRWQETYAELLNFRHWIKRKYRVYLDDELHAGDMINKPGQCPATLQRLKKHERLAIIRHHADALAQLPSIRFINVVVDKLGAPDKSSDMNFKHAWYALFQRFENTIRCQNFPGPPNSRERGIVFPDQTDASRLRDHLQKMRVQNYLSIRQASGRQTTINEPIRLLIEDPICRDSRHSYFIQAVDCAVFLLKQYIQPNTHMKKHGGNAYFPSRLKPVLCTHASRTDPLGIVRL